MEIEAQYLMNTPRFGAKRYTRHSTLWMTADKNEFTRFLDGDLSEYVRAFAGFDDARATMWRTRITD